MGEHPRLTSDEFEASDGTEAGGGIEASDEPAEHWASAKLERRRRGRTRRRPRRRRFTWRGRLLLGAGVLVVLLGLIAAAGYGYLSYRNGQIKRIKVSHLVAAAKTGPDVGTQTFLLIGSTSRCALKKQNPAFGTCAQGITGVNSDVIILLRADQRTHSISVLSIPRDLVLYGVRPGDQFYKIDAALADGPGQLVAAIEQDFGIPINHFVELNFDTFQNVVNALGGVDMYFPYAETDSFSSLNISTPGCHHLDGFQALAVVRARHLSYKVNGQWQYDGSGDLGRIIRVHEFLKVLAQTVHERGIGNPLRDNALLGAIAPQLTVDSGLSLGDLVNLVLVFHSVNPATAPMATMPNIEDHADYIFDGYDVGSVVLPAYPQDQEAIDRFEGRSQPPGSAIPPASVTVSVLNGTYSTGEESAVAARLSSLGYHVVGTGTATPAGPVSEATVYYRPGHQLQAERLVESLHGIVSMAEGPTQDGADVTLVTGSNFSVVVPSHHTAQRTHTTVPANPFPVLGPVSSPFQALPPYDPRACPATTR